MKIFGHPLHVMLVHFPSALFPMDIVCSLIALYTGDISFVHASFYAAAGGVILGWLSVIFGLFDLIPVSEKYAYAMKKALLHGGINTVVVVIYTVLAYIQYKQYPHLHADSSAVLLAKAVAIFLMLAGNFIGGSLILKYKVAVHESETK